MRKEMYCERPTNLWLYPCVHPRPKRGSPAAAKAKGVHFGRPEAVVPDDFAKIVHKYKKGQLSAKEAMQMCGMGKATFYRKLKEFRAMNKKEKK